MEISEDHCSHLRGNKSVNEGRKASWHRQEGFDPAEGGKREGRGREEGGIGTRGRKLGK